MAGFFLRIFERNTSSLWTDEFATYWISSASSLGECIARANPTQGQSPFYYILEWLVLKLFPHNEHSLRLLSLLSSLVSIYLVYEIGLQLFLKQNNAESSEQGNTKIPVFSLPAFFATTLFAFDINQIYYSQEARPYAMAIMFALFSQLFFLKLLHHKTKGTIISYVIFSALICYTHYIFGTMLLFQNIWVLLSLLKEKRAETEDRSGKVPQGPISLKLWCMPQIAIIVLLLPLFTHLVPILKHSSKWTWLKSGGIIYAGKIFATLFDFRFLMIFFGVFIMLLAIDLIKKGKSGQQHFSQRKKRNIIFLLIWFITPPLFAYLATIILRTSLLDARYMILSLIPFYLLSAALVEILKNQNVKIFLVSFILCSYIGGVLVPALKKEGRFCYRIPHDWRAAISVLNQNLKPNDVIVLRSGYVKENWLPETNDPIIIEYVKAPLNSFYFKPAIYTKPQSSPINIYNMTYTKENEFYPYYDSIFDVCGELQRVWIIGVNPPNSNYLMSQVPEIMRNSHGKVFEKDFAGVYLVLLKKRPDVYRIFKNK